MFIRFNEKFTLRALYFLVQDIFTFM